jgi:hypothetical protein
MTGTKAALPLQLKKESLLPLLSVQATGVCIPAGNTEMLPAAVYKSLQSME